MIKISYKSYYDDIDSYLINQENIVYMTVKHTDISKYPKVTSHRLFIHFSNEECLKFETTDNDEFNKWLELFGVKSNE
jgi:hypothetical protein